MNYDLVRYLIECAIVLLIMPWAERQAYEWLDSFEMFQKEEKWRESQYLLRRQELLSILDRSRFIMQSPHLYSEDVRKLATETVSWALSELTQLEQSWEANFLK